VYFSELICKTTPNLILQGTAHWRVPADQVINLTLQLYKVKQPFRFVWYEGGQHSLAEYDIESNTLLMHWFDTYLRDGKKWPSLDGHGR